MEFKGDVHFRLAAHPVLNRNLKYLRRFSSPMRIPPDSNYINVLTSEIHSVLGIHNLEFTLHVFLLMQGVHEVRMSIF